MNYEQLSLLEIAIELMREKGEPTPILDIIGEALKIKGIDDSDGVQSTRLYMDITASSDFVLCDGGKWDLKANQSLDMFDRDGSAYIVQSEEEDEKEDSRKDEVGVNDFDLDEDNDQDYDDEDEDEDYDDEDEDNYGDEDEDDYDYDDDDDDDNDYLDEDKYNQYMDDYEEMYDNH